MGTSKISIPCILFALVFQVNLLAGDRLSPHYPYYTKRIGDTIHIGISHIFNREYDRAVSLFSKLTGAYPNRPEGPFCLAAAYQIKMMEERSTTDESAYYYFRKEGYSRAKAIVSPTPWDLFVTGGLHGLEALYALNKGRYTTAVYQGIRALRYFKRVKKKDPSIQEVNIALGMYLYIRSRLAERYWIFSFFSNKKEAGLELIRKGANTSVFGQDIGRLVLMELYRWEQNYRLSLQMANALIQKYPRNTMARIEAGRIYCHLKAYQQAKSHYTTILSNAPRLPIAMYLLGYTLQMEGKDIAAARKWYWKTYRALRENPEHRRLYAYAAFRLSQLIEKDDSIKAKRLKNEAIAIVPRLQSVVYAQQDFRWYR